METQRLTIQEGDRAEILIKNEAGTRTIVVPGAGSIVIVISRGEMASGSSSNRS